MAFKKKSKTDDAVEASKRSKGDVEAPPPEAPVPLEAAAPTAKAWPDDMPLYRVARTKIISLRGAMTKLPEGKVINPRHYGGPAGIDALVEAGVELEPIG